MSGWFIGRRATFGVGLILLAFAVVVAVSFQTTRTLTDSIALTHHTYEVIDAITDVRIALTEAEAARRGYALTGEQQSEDSFHDSLAQVTRYLERVNALTSDNNAQQQHLASLDPLLAERVRNLRAGLEKIDSDIALEQQLMLTREGMAQAHKVRTLLETMENAELHLLADRKDQVEKAARASQLLLITGGVLGGFMAFVVLISLNRQMATRAMSESQLRAAHGDISHLLEESELRNETIVFLSELSGLLQACRSYEEVFGIVRESIGRGFPAQAGALSTIKASRNAVVVRTTWGDWGGTPPEFAPEECWALRRGQLHIDLEGKAGVRCKHLPPGDDGFLCVPLVAHGEAQGVLTLKNIGAEWQSEARQRYAEMLAETIGMALANLELRERLMNQAITDTLTGLLNRRYMEETLTRELSRADREKFPVSVILLDVDHFKQFNDTHGHQAGDEVLRCLGEFLRNNIRSGDFACRYGGEEFALVMAGSPIKNAAARAEHLRKNAHNLNVKFAGRSLGNITLSLGVAAAPDHGTTLDQLLQTADKMLYRAKQAGRDRVCVAPADGEDAHPGISHAEGI